jgi:hypothetical protein
MADPDHLSIKSELLRKTVGTLSDAYAEWERGERSDESLKATFDAVYSTVSGLLDWEDIDPIMAEFRALALQSARPMKALYKGADLVLISGHNDAMHVHKFRTDGLNAPQVTQRRNLRILKQLTEAMTAKGWREI